MLHRTNCLYARVDGSTALRPALSLCAGGWEVFCQSAIVSMRGWMGVGSACRIVSMRGWMGVKNEKEGGHDTEANQEDSGI